MRRLRVRAMVAVNETQRVLLIHILRSLNGKGETAIRAMEEAERAGAGQNPGSRG